MRARDVLMGIALFGLMPVATSDAAETVVLNDSTVGGTPSTVANLFLAGEEVGSWLTATCTCLLGVAGDWVIRAVIDCDAPATVPATQDVSRIVLALALLSFGGFAALSLRARRHPVAR